MIIHREGYAVILVVFLILLFINAIVFYFVSNTIIPFSLLGLSLVFFFLVLFFFRVPNRELINNDNLVIAPADGKIVVIEKVFEPEYYKAERLQVSIFMSPLNVHLQRYPINGVLKYVKYHPGKYLVAWHPKASTLNERTSIVIDNEAKGKSLLLRQIAGTVARRIIYYSKEGEIVKQNSELGFIRFGSRVDLFLPLDTDIKVKIGDKVTNGQTIIAGF